MELFLNVSAVILTLITTFGIGWGVHAFFHRRSHDSLMIRISKLEQDLKEAKEGQKVVVSIQNYTPESIEQLKLSQDEVRLLQFIVEEGVFGPPDHMSMNRSQLAGARLSEKGLIDEDQDGTHATRLALEWMDQSNLLN